MHELRLAMQKGLDVTLYAETEVSAEMMKAARKLQGLDVKVDHELLNIYTIEQLEEIRLGHKYGLDVSKFDNPNLTPSQMEKIRLYELTQHIITLIKEKAMSLFNSLLDHIPLKASAISAEEQVSNAIINVLKNTDYSKFNTLQKLSDHITEMLRNPEKFDVRPDMDEPVEEKNPAIEKYEVIDTIELYGKNIAFLKQLTTGDYIIADNYVAQGENLMSWEDETTFETIEDAKVAFQGKVFEAVKMAQSPTIKATINIDDGISDELKDMVKHMDSLEVSKVADYLSNLEHDCSEEEVKNALLQSDQIKFTNLQVNDGESPTTAVGKLYATQNGLQTILDAQNATNSFDYEKYGQEIIETNNLVLSETGFYQVTDTFNLKQVPAAVPTEPEKMAPKAHSTNFEVNVNTTENLNNARTELQTVMKSHIDSGVEESIKLKVLNQGNVIYDHTYSPDEFKAMYNESVLSRVNVLDKVLEGMQLDFQETLELDLPADTIAM